MTTEAIAKDVVLTSLLSKIQKCDTWLSTTPKSVHPKINRLRGAYLLRMEKLLA